MIITQSMRRDQHERRMMLKTAGAAFAGLIVRGTNCSEFESEIIVEKAMEVFGLGQWEEPRVLQDGQIVFYAVSVDAKPGCEIGDCPKLRLVLKSVSRQTIPTVCLSGLFRINGPELAESCDRAKISTHGWVPDDPDNLRK